MREPEGHGLNDIYVRFFSMAERRITERTRQGVVCFISNYSWLDGLSFTGMRERYLEAFDAVRIDCLNGDKYATGKVAPDGSPDPSIFSREGDPVGIQIGTAIATLVRKSDHAASSVVEFRHLWGQAKPAQLASTAESNPNVLYEEIKPVLPLGLPFVRTRASDGWFDWPALTELFPVSFPGVKTSRDAFLVDVDLDRLRARVRDYFDVALSYEEIARRYPSVMKSKARFDARQVRDELLRRGGPDASGFIRYAYRPFDTRWLYWEAETKLLDEKRAEYKPYVFDGNLWLVTQQKPRRGWSPPQVISHIGCLDLMDRGATCIPMLLRGTGTQKGDQSAVKANVRRAKFVGEVAVQHYIDHVGVAVEDLFYHVLATLHDPAYHEANAGALRMGWPRIPLPGWPDGKTEGAADLLATSAARGRELAALLDPDTPVPGVTQAPLRATFAAIAVPATAGGRYMTGGDFFVTAGWGHRGSGDAVMPGQGRALERAYTADERAAIGHVTPTLGETTFDIHLNGSAFWSNVPAAVWTYKLGGYQVLKKWLSYRERGILGRALTAEEVQNFTDIARRIASMLTIAGLDSPLSS